MGFDDLFENHEKHRSSQNYREQGHSDGYNYAGRQADYKHQQRQYFSYFMSKIWSNRRLRFIAIVFAFIVVVLAVIIIIALLPLLFKLVDYVFQSGVKGILDSITSFIDKLWKGTGK